MRAYNATPRAGEKVVEIGRFIVCSAVKIAKTAPKTAFGMVAGAILGALVFSIPLIGFLLGPIIMRLAVLLGGLWGTLEDIRDAALKREIQREVKKHDAFRTACQDTDFDRYSRVSERYQFDDSPSLASVTPPRKRQRDLLRPDGKACNGLWTNTPGRILA